MTHAFSDVLLVGGRPNQWVKYVNNDGNAAHVYVSTAVTTFQTATTGAGVYTFSPSPIGGIYTSYLIDGSLSATAPAAADIRWAATGITSHVVAYTAGDDAALDSVTATTGPYVNRASQAGQSVFGAGPIYDVAAYGTFTGTDDTATLAAAVAALPSNAILWISRDVSGNPWVTSSTLLISGLTNVWIDGPGAIKLKNASNVPVIRFLNCTGGGVRNVTVDGNQANNTVPGAAGNQCIAIGNVATGSTQVSVIGCRIQNAYNDGVNVLNSTRCIVQDNYITGCGTNAGGSPIHFIQGSHDGLILGNVCDSNSYGIYLDDNAVTACNRCRVIGNVVSNTTGTNAALAQGAGICLVGTPYTLVEGNTCYGSASLRGIVVFPGTPGFTADFSSVINNVCNNNGHNGIDVTGNFLRVIGNHCEANAQSGIFLSANPNPIDSSWNVVSFNVCRNNGTSGAGGTVSHDGIVINTITGANVTDNLFEGNICTDNGTGTQLYGIEEWQANASYLRNSYIGNSLRGNGTAGIKLLGTTNTLRDNQGVNPHIVQSPVYAASFTPDLTLGDFIAIGALTAGITINNFAAAQLYQGQIVTFKFLQDGTGGRGVTWNAAYKTAWQPAKAASAISTISFQYDGTNWQQVAGQLAVDQTSGLGYLPQDLHILQGTRGLINDGGSLLLGAASASQFLFNVTGAGNVAIMGSAGRFSTYYGLTTQGAGLPVIVQAPAPTIGTVAAAVNPIATVTSPSDGVKHIYEISGSITITTLGSGVINLQVTYTDDSGGVRTCNIPLTPSTGAYGAAANTADQWKGHITISVQPNTAVSVLTAGTFTGCTYNCSAQIKQVV